MRRVGFNVSRAGSPVALLGCCALLTLGCEPRETGDQEPMTPASELTPLAQEPAPQNRFGEATVTPSEDAVPSTGDVESDIIVARADLQPASGSEVTGSAEFNTREDGSIRIVVRAQGLEPGATHGMHIHEVGDCSAPDASSAGSHFSPEERPHGAPRDGERDRHAGDLGNITANQQGMATKELRDSVLALDGAYSVVGRAIIVHSGEDDLTSQPSGNAGDPIACGVIRMAEEAATQEESAV